MTVILLSLLRLSLFGVSIGEDVLCKLRSFSEEEWNALLEEARRQTVSGLLYKALELMPEGISMPEDVAFDLVDVVNQGVKRNIRMMETEKEILGFFRNAGFHPVVMKGSTCAALYPFPELRNSGDIDLYFTEAEYDEAVKAAGNAGMDYSKRPDSSMVLILHDVIIELHRKYYDLHYSDLELPDISSPEARILMLSSHILKHACSSGVGLRQICDFALAYNSYNGDKAALDTMFSHLGLSRWHHLLLSFINCYLSLPIVTSGNTNNPLPMLRIIESGGNFGHYARNREKHLGKTSLFRKADTVRRITGHIPFSLRYAPRETFYYLSELIKGNLSRRRYTR